jgi:hypothetical protein
MIYVLDFRDRDVGGAVVPGRLLQLPALSGLGKEEDLALEPKVTFLLHGFNVSRPKGWNGLLSLAANLPAAAAGGIVAVLWPGDHWTGAISYSFEGPDADDSGCALARYIELALRPGTELSFVSYSLGARVVMETLRRLPEYRVRQVCLMAAAIDDSSLADPALYRSAVERASRVAVLASKNDRVLKLAYPAGDALQAFFFAQDTVDLALGYHGPRSSGERTVPDRVVCEQIPNDRRSDHGHYIPDPAEPLPAALANQLSAARFANEVLGGAANPRYT